MTRRVAGPTPVAGHDVVHGTMTNAEAPGSSDDGEPSGRPPLPSAPRGLARGLTGCRTRPPSDDLDCLLCDVRQCIRRYVVLSDPQATATTLWVAHCHAFAAAEATPYLNVTSAVKQSGKTRLLEVLEPIVPASWLTGRVSAAVLTRKVDAETPTLLLDESDAAFKHDCEYSEALRSILNSGYRRSGICSLCVGQGAGLTYRDFSTFCPKAIAGIGALPDTVTDRSIRITLKRRAPYEWVERFRQRDAPRIGEPLRAQLAAWRGTAVEELRDAEPALPTELSDRAADVWEPLIAIADLAGNDWPTRARGAATALSGMASSDDDTLAICLLADVGQVFTEETIGSADLVDRLVRLEDRPWAEWTGGQPITQARVARLLKPFGTRPTKLRFGARTANGYTTRMFADPWSRYLPNRAEQWNAANNDEDERGPRRVKPDRAGSASDTVVARDRDEVRSGVPPPAGETGPVGTGDEGEASDGQHF